jgi:hypothetical protein
MTIGKHNLLPVTLENSQSFLDRGYEDGWGGGRMAKRLDGPVEKYRIIDQAGGSYMTCVIDHVGRQLTNMAPVVC